VDLGGVGAIKMDLMATEVDLEMRVAAVEVAGVELTLMKRAVIANLKEGVIMRVVKVNPVMKKVAIPKAEDTVDQISITESTMS
jgi:hypothetical protein